MSKFFITTPIYYINDRPHIGHAYSTIAADVLARYHRQHGDNVLFTSGTDENSQKTVLAAQAKGQDVQAYTDGMAKLWQQTWDSLGISYDRFIRTTAADHQAAVYALIEKVQAAGDIYEGEYEGLYCTGCEEFKRQSDLVDGKCPIHKTTPQLVKEVNYFFKLSKYEKLLLNHVQKNLLFVQPDSRRNEVISFIKQGLHDFPISRANAQWGIRWPGNPSQAVYVWFDALTNYLTVSGYPDAQPNKWWPANVHLVGKDIIKFHCIYWPAMLMSAGLELPETVFAHGFFTVDGQKISKSLGNATEPMQLAGDYGVDALRYFLLREIPFGQDGEFNRQRFAAVYESDLANELGNLVQRVAAMITKYQEGVTGDIPKHSHDIRLYTEAINNFRLDKALEEIWLKIKGLNQFIEEEKPWTKTKDKPELEKVLGHAVSDLTQIADLLLPFMPATAERIIKTFEGGIVHPEVGILFPKFDNVAKKR